MIPFVALALITFHFRKASIAVERQVVETLARDRGQKQRIYARAGVPEYWIVNVEDRCVEVRCEPDPMAT